MIWPYRSKWTVKVRFWIWQRQWLSFLTHQLDLDLHLAATIIIISYPSTQWAAVITWLCEIRLPPQKDVFLSSTICERVIPIHVMLSFSNTHKSCHPRPLIFSSILSTDNTTPNNISFSTRYGGGIIWNEKRCFFLSVSHRTAFLQYFHTCLLWTEPWSSNGKAANSHFLTDLMGDFNVNPPCFSWPSGKIYGKQIVSKSNEKQQAEILVNFVEANFMENYQHCHKREIKMTWDRDGEVKLKWKWLGIEKWKWNEKASRLRSEIFSRILENFRDFKN